MYLCDKNKILNNIFIFFIFFYISITYLQIIKSNCLFYVIYDTFNAYVELFISVTCIAYLMIIQTNGLVLICMTYLMITYIALIVYFCDINCIFNDYSELSIHFCGKHDIFKYSVLNVYFCGMYSIFKTKTRVIVYFYDMHDIFKEYLI